MKQAGVLIYLAIMASPPVGAASSVAVDTVVAGFASDDLCSIDEAFAVSAGPGSVDCQVIVAGEVDPLVIVLQSAATYQRVAQTLTLGVDGGYASVEIEGNNAVIQRADEAAVPFSLVTLLSPALVVRDLSLRGGRADQGAGLNAGDITGDNRFLRLERVTFEDNRAQGLGVGQGRGGALAYRNGALELVATTFRDNGADLAAGAVDLTTITGLIADSLFERNSAQLGGALSLANSDLRVVGSHFLDNQASVDGGAIATATNQAVAVSRSRFVGNDAGQHGGAIQVAGPMSVVQTLFEANTANDGGALYRGLPLSGTLTVANSTFFGNSASGAGGGAFFERGRSTLTSSTVAFNTANSGGGVLVGTNPGTGLIVDHALIGGNSAVASVPNCAGPRDPGGGYSLLASDCTFPFVTGDIRVDSLDTVLESELRDNGGPTHTLALLPRGPARNAGNRSYLDTTSVDQRGLPRIVEGRVDIGAFEVGALAVNNLNGFLFASSFEDQDLGSGPIRFTSRQAFLDHTGALDATGALPELGDLVDDPGPLQIGSVSFLRIGTPSFSLMQWTDELPELAPADTVDLALTGFEDFDLQVSEPVVALGFDFADADGDGTRLNLLACRTTFDPEIDTCPLADIVYTADFSADDTTRKFVGFALSEPFLQVSIREQTNSNSDEYFGHVYTRGAPAQ